MSTVRVAAVDCGTNAIRLLVADVDLVSGTLVDLDRRMEIVRLGEGVDATGRLSAGALERTFAACERYAEVIASLGAEHVRFVATSASRDAANRAAFVDGVRARIGVEPEVISGDEEARLSFVGATRGLEGGTPPYLVVDIGGGSTEFVLGSQAPVAASSVDVGCVRMTERHVRHDPPSAGEVESIVADVDAAISRAAEGVPLGEARTLVGLAGSVTTAAAIALDLPEYLSERIHGSRITAAQVDEVSDRLLGMDKAARAAVPVMHPGRVDVINAGVLVLRRVLARTGLTEVLVSEHDILDGVCWSLAELHHRPWRIEPRDPADPACVAAVAAYSAELDAVLGPSSPTISDPRLDDYRPPTGSFLVVVRDDEVLGCAGLRTIATSAYGDVAEVKRMWVSPALRGQGAGRALLDRLHGEARRLGRTRVVLDSKRELDDARRLYLAAGYVEVERYNDNADATVWMLREL